MPTNNKNRLNINLTTEKDINDIKELAVELQAITKEHYSYIDIVRMLVAFGRSYPNSIISHNS